MRGTRPRAPSGPAVDQIRRRQRYNDTRIARLILPPRPVPIDTGPAPVPGFRKMAFSGHTVGAHIAPAPPVEEARPELSHPLERPPFSFEGPGHRDPGRGSPSFEESSHAHETPNPAVGDEFTFSLQDLLDYWNESFPDFP